MISSPCGIQTHESCIWNFFVSLFFFCVVDSLCVCMQFKRVYIFCYHIRSSISNLGQKIQNFNRLISSNSNLNHFSHFWQNFEYCINLNVLSHWQYFFFMMKLYFVTGKSKTGPILDFLVATLHWKEIKPLFSFIVRKKIRVISCEWDFTHMNSHLQDRSLIKQSLTNFPTNEISNQIFCHYNGIKIH